MTRSPDPTTLPRLFVTPLLREGDSVTGSREQAHYLGHVLRRETGGAVRLFNGQDGEWLAHLAFTGRDRVQFTPSVRLRAQEPEHGPWLVFALLKRDATDLVVRQAVELGVSRLLPAITQRTIAARVNEERLRAIALEAAEQCERLTVPAIDPPRGLDEILAAWPTERRLFAALERTAHTQKPMSREPAGLLIGPEGGFTATEREGLLRHPFAAPLSLGPTVLRAETAATAGLALLLQPHWAEYPMPT